MRWCASLTRVVMILCVVLPAVASALPLPAYAGRQQTAGAHALTADAAAPMTLTVTVADNGSTVQVGAGGDLLLELRGNPSTGYRWQVSANDDSILLPVAAWFVPDSDLLGSPGLEKFSFHVMAPGTASLRLVYSRPWETDTPPVQTFTVTVEAVDQAAPSAPVTVGGADDGKTISLLPGQLLHVALEGDSTGAWKFTDGDPLIVQQLGAWVTTPLGGSPARFLFTRTFLGVQPGTVNLEFGFNVFSDPEWRFDPTFLVTVVVPPVQPGNSIAVGAGDTGKDVRLAAGDALVVRLRAIPSAGYEWRVMATDATLLPTAGTSQCVVYREVGTGMSEACTFRFLAQAAGIVTVRLGNFPPGQAEPENVIDYNVTIVDPAPMNGNTVLITPAQAGSALRLKTGDRLDVALDPSAGDTWRVMAHDPALLRVLPTVPTNAGAVYFFFQAVAAGQADLAIGLYPANIPTPRQTFTVTTTVDWAQHQYLPTVARPLPSAHAQ